MPKRRRAGRIESGHGKAECGGFASDRKSLAGARACVAVERRQLRHEERAAPFALLERASHAPRRGNRVDHLRAGTAREICQPHVLRRERVKGRNPRVLAPSDEHRETYRDK
jgi:hypothetical protein